MSPSPESELIQDVIDTTRLSGLLPLDPVKVNDSWKPESGVIKSLCDLDHFIEADVKCTLISVDKTTAKIKLAGTVKGLAIGTQVKSEIQANLLFDREAQIIRQVKWKQTDLRTAGPVSPAGAYQPDLTLIGLRFVHEMNNT